MEIKTSDDHEEEVQRPHRAIAVLKSHRRHSVDGPPGPRGMQLLREALKAKDSHVAWERELPGIEGVRRVLLKPSSERTRMDVDVVTSFFRRMRKKLRFFRDKSDGVLALLASVMNVCELRPHEVVFHQGDEGDLLYVVMAGSCGVYIDVDPSARAAGGGRASRSVRTAADAGAVAKKALRDLIKHAKDLEASKEVKQSVSVAWDALQEAFEGSGGELPGSNADAPCFVRLGVANGIISDGLAGIDPHWGLGTAVGSTEHSRAAAAQHVKRLRAPADAMGPHVGLEVQSTRPNASSSGGDSSSDPETSPRGSLSRRGVPYYNLIVIPTLSARLAWSQRGADSGSTWQSLMKRGRELNIATIVAGNAFGELALRQDARPRAATVRSGTSSSLCFTVSRADFRAHRELRSLLDSSSDQVTFMMSLAYLRDVPKSDAISLAYSLTPIEVPRGAVLYNAGEMSPVLYIIRRGECVVEASIPVPKTEEESHGTKEQGTAPSVARVPIGRAEKGAAIGVESVLLGRPCAFTYRTDTVCTVFEIGFDVFNRVSNPASNSILREWANLAHVHAASLKTVLSERKRLLVSDTLESQSRDISDGITRRVSEVRQPEESRRNRRHSVTTHTAHVRRTLEARVDSTSRSRLILPDILVPKVWGGHNPVSGSRLRNLAHAPPTQRGDESFARAVETASRSGSVSVDGRSSAASSRASRSHKSPQKTHHRSRSDSASSTSSSSSSSSSSSVASAHSIAETWKMAPLPSSLGAMTAPKPEKLSILPTSPKRTLPASSPTSLFSVPDLPVRKQKDPTFSRISDPTRTISAISSSPAALAAQDLSIHVRQYGCGMTESAARAAKARKLAMQKKIEQEAAERAARRSLIPPEIKQARRRTSVAGLTSDMADRVRRASAVFESSKPTPSREGSASKDQDSSPTHLDRRPIRFMARVLSTDA